MNSFKWKEGYKSALTVRETQKAIEFVRDTFQAKLSEALCLERISAPLFVTRASGINDDLNGVERKVGFDIKETGEYAEVVQSLAKWKRMALYRYGFEQGKGLYTNMCAIRRDDDMDNDHSIYVDQWDWERVISKEERNLDFLKAVVRKIVDALADTKAEVNKRYPMLHNEICRDITFITSQELEDKYPDLTPKMREKAFVKDHKTTFVMQIGGALASGEIHDGRAPDYDDWNLNGDLLFWNEVLEQPIELSSMGIRVDEDSLKKQLCIRHAEDRLQFPYHKGIIDGTLPLTVGGGIGQSRVCMYLLEKLHIGEVQASIWTEETVNACREHGVQLL